MSRTTFYNNSEFLESTNQKLINVIYYRKSNQVNEEREWEKAEVQNVLSKTDSCHAKNGAHIEKYWSL